MTYIVMFVIGMMLLALSSTMIIFSGGDIGPPPDPAEVAAKHAAFLHTLESFGKGAAATIVVGVLIVLAWHVIADLMEGNKMRRKARRDTERRNAEQRDPVAIATRDAPDMLPDVRTSLERMDLLRSLGTSAHSQETADAVALADGSLRQTLDGYVLAVRSATDEERRGIARTALTAVVDAGQIAEDARRGAVTRLSAAVEDNARYIATRAGRDGLQSMP